MSRLFVAVEIESALHDELAKVQNELKRLNLDIRWVATKNIHLTLRFLGEIEETRIDTIKKALNETASKYPVAEINLEELGAFPTANNPRVIWIGCKEKGNILTRFYTDLEQKLQAAGLAKDDHPFSPHLTLGRVKSRLRMDLLKTYLEQKKDIRLGTQKVPFLTLFQSTLMQTGPIYTSIAKFNLKGG